MASSTYRNSFLDAIRGISILMVLLFHVNVHLQNLIYDDIYQLLRYGRHGVEVFFMISGYFIFSQIIRHHSRQQENISLLVKKRFIRIYPVFLISLLVAISLNYMPNLLKAYVPDYFQTYQMYNITILVFCIFHGVDYGNQYICCQ